MALDILCCHHPVWGFVPVRNIERIFIVRIGLSDIIYSSASFKIKTLKFFDLTLGGLLAHLACARKKNPFEDQKIRNILIIRPGGIGDAVFLLPFLKALKEERPSLEIDILCEKRNREVFTLEPKLVRDVFVYDSLRSFFSLMKNKYDLVVDTEQWHYLSALTSVFLRPGYNVGFNTRPLREKLFNRPVEFSVDAYELENFKRLFAVFSKKAESLRDIDGTLQVSGQVTGWARGQIPAGCVCLQLGASIEPRTLTVQQAETIIRFFLNKGLPVVLLGAAATKQAGRALQEKIKSGQLKNLIGQTTLSQSVAILKESKLFVGQDSGLLHLACAIGVPTVAIFGPGNKTKWAPRGDRHKVISLDVACSPCTFFGYTVVSCKGTFHCMRGIDFERFYPLFEESLGENK